MANFPGFAVFAPSPLAILFLIGVFVVVAYFSYQWLLPRPIPGIPYNKTAAKSLFGDIPQMMAHAASTKEVFQWLTLQNVKLSSPIVQVFARPFSKPWIILSDFRESQDILMRRTREFDRSDFIGDIFRGLIPDHHLPKKSMDPEFKRNRRLLQDLMSPGFLNEVCHFLKFI
jgi:hypothetical protein